MTIAAPVTTCRPRRIFEGLASYRVDELVLAEQPSAADEKPAEIRVFQVLRVFSRP
jgi:hypothetical protein